MALIKQVAANTLIAEVQNSLANITIDITVADSMDLKQCFGSMGKHPRISLGVQSPSGGIEYPFDDVSLIAASSEVNGGSVLSGFDMASFKVDLTHLGGERDLNGGSYIIKIDATKVPGGGCTNIDLYGEGGSFKTSNYKLANMRKLQSDQTKVEFDVEEAYAIAFDVAAVSKVLIVSKQGQTYERSQEELNKMSMAQSLNQYKAQQYTSLENLGHNITTLLMMPTLGISQIIFTTIAICEVTKFETKM